MYDYKISLTGTGDRSSVDTFDDTIFSSLLCHAHLIGTKASAYAVFSALLNLLCRIHIMNTFSFASSESAT